METRSVTSGEDLAQVLVEAKPGDEIVIGPHKLARDPSSPRPYSGEFVVRANGTEEKPIRVRALEGAVFSGPWSFYSSHVVFDGLHWEHFGGAQHIGRDCSENNPIRGLVFRNCLWAHSAGAQRAWFVEDLRYERCHWRDNRSRQAGIDCNAWALMRYGKRITFSQCTAEDFGSDWIQIMPNSPTCGPAEDILIRDCRAWINRPYGSVSWQNWGPAVGENCIDVKGHRTRRVTVCGGEYGGIRPVVPGQDASGGDGPVMVVHFGARDVRFEQVRIYDAPYGVSVSRGSETGGDAPTGNVQVLGCTFDDVDMPVRVGKDADGNLLDVTVNPDWRPAAPGPDLAALRAQLVEIESGLVEMEGALASYADAQRLRIAQIKSFLGKSLGGLA